VRAWRRYLEFFGRTPQQDLADELRFHFETEIEELIAAGRSPEEARREALAKFGDVDRYRAEIVASDARRIKRRERARLADTFVRDVRYALRGLARRPMFAIACVTILAIGVGANAAMFSVIDHVFLRPPGAVSEAGELRRLVVERQRRDGTRYFQVRFSWPEIRRIDSAVSARFPSAIFFRRDVRVETAGGAARLITGNWISSSFFSVVGVRLHAGSNFSAEDTTFGVPARSAIISWALWEREFGGDSAVLGRVIRVNGEPTEIRGITPRGFSGIDVDATEIWLPAPGLTEYNRGNAHWHQSWGMLAFRLVARVPPGASDAELVAHIEAGLRVARAVQEQEDPGWQFRADISRVIASPIHAALGPERISQREAMALVLAAFALLLLAIATANVANLMLGRALDRRREVAVRVAVGMDRIRLVGQVAVEALVLAALATLAAVVAAAATGNALRAALLPGIDFPTAPVDARIAALAIALGFLVAVVATVVPLQPMLRLDVGTFLKLGRDGGTQRPRLRATLVAVQAALSVVLLVGTGLLGRSLYNVRSLDLGLDAELLVGVELDDDAARAREVASVARALPGVTVVAHSAMIPMWENFEAPQMFTQSGDSVRSLDRDVKYVAGDSAYLAAVGTRVLRGRGITAQDVAGSEPVMIVSEHMAQRVWPGRDPLAERECLRIASPSNPCYTVVGIAENAHQYAVVEAPRSGFYVPLAQRPTDGNPGRALVIRAATLTDVRPLAAHLRRVLGDTGTTVSSQRVRVLADVLAPQYRPWEVGARLFGGLAALALGLALFGLYAVLDYNVTLRRRDLGIRLALGADRRTLVALIVGEGMTLVTVGAVAGVAVALMAAERVTPLLYGVSPRDPTVIVAAFGILVLFAIAGSLIPARRAISIDPVRAIAAE
jgi:putative ABC transport system permease protein